MAALEAPEILGQIEVLVTDKLEVVSYKWLSRNFSVTSNHAKRLLQKFVDKYEDKVEVLYSLSGWLKNCSEKYCIRLASGHKLEEAMMEFDGNCSIEVYSIQSCIPKDLAVLWNAEFVQAEELFNQPSTVENCLRNNRFGGISNPFVKRVVNGQLAATSTSQLKDNLGIVQTKAAGIPNDKTLQCQQEKGGQLGTKEGLNSSSTMGSVCKTDQTVGDYTTKPGPAKESTNPPQANRKGVPKEKTSSGTGGSLATLWGRASVKLKPPSMAVDATSNILNAAYTADAQICAEEATDSFSSDDEGYSISCRRVPNESGTRKRRFIMNYSDEENEDDNVVSLASPILSNENSFSDSLQRTKSLNMEKEKFSTDLKTETSVNKQDNIEEKKYGLSPEKGRPAEASLLKTESSLQNEPSNQKVKNNAPMPSKRKKVIKTRIDEHGREVSEVVWEEPICSKDVDKDSNTIDAENRPASTANKEQSTGSNNLAINAIKGGTKKPVKSGVKDVKQGKNILSFFKKV